ncbi:MAG: Uma2 family endonuclease [Saprospiraceae bacterium]
MAELALAPTAAPAVRRSEKIPDAFVYEIIRGKKYYFRGYRDVMNKTKQLSEIMSCSGLQAFILDYFSRIIHKSFDEDEFIVLSNEVGLQFVKKEWFSCDMALFRAEVLTPQMITKKLVNVVPEVVIEVDVQADLADTKEVDYIHEKTADLLRFGVKKVIWIFSSAEMLLLAENGETDWRWRSWDEDATLWQNVPFNIGNYLKKKGLR